jgi:hypothetical protein
MIDHRANATFGEVATLGTVATGPSIRSSDSSPLIRKWGTFFRSPGRSFQSRAVRSGSVTLAVMDDAMEYQDSEQYRDETDTDTGESFVIKGRTDDGQVIVEMDIDTEAHKLLIEQAERTGRTVSEIVNDIVREYTAEVFRESPHLAEVMEFRESFGPGLYDPGLDD